MKPVDRAATVPTVAGDQAQQLFSWLLTQPLEGYEKSFKMSATNLLDQRYLAGIAVDRLPHARLLDICHKLEMPGEFMARLNHDLADADTLHFGYEQGANCAIFKLYFEYWRRLDAARVRGEESFVLHHAYKWDAMNSTRRAVASYRCFPRLSHPQALMRIARLYPDQVAPPVLELVRELMRLTAAHGSELAMYIEVSEADNPRASFDLNFHAAELKLAVIEPQLAALATRYSIPAEQFAPLWQSLAAKTLGHLSGGTSRDGQDFLTIYYDPLS